MIINHNIPAMNAHRNMGLNNLAADRTMESLSSGLRINRAADDAAGLAVSEKMRGQIRGLSMASRNTQDGISMIQTAEGFLNETTAALQRIRELAVQSANGVYESSDREMIQTEVSQLISEIDRIAEQAEFNDKLLFRGDFANPNIDQSVPVNPDNAAAAAAAGPNDSSVTGNGISLQVGANIDQFIEFYLEDVSATALGLKGGAEGDNVDVTTVAASNRSLATIDEALDIVTKQRTDLGAVQNRLENAMRGIDVAVENLQSAESRVRDTDMANSMIQFVRDNILTQSSISMLAQANLRPQAILRVLG